MSVKRFRCTELFRPLGRLLAALLLTAPWNVLAEAPSLCSDAGVLMLDTTSRFYEGKRACFRLDLPSSGLLALHVSAPGSPAAEPWLVFLGRGPEGVPGVRVPGGGRDRIVRRTPRSVILEVGGPGPLFLAVAPEDPARPLDGYKLSNAFVPDPDRQDDEPGSLDAKASESCHAAGPSPSSQSSGGPSSRITPADVDEVECDIREGALWVPPPGGPGAFFALCGAGETDDHGDSPLCATPLELGASATGTIENASGDDEDVFTFLVDKIRGVRIGAAAAGHATLYDARGQRLAASGDGLEDPRVVRTLSPGHYYVRLQNLWVPGERYVLSLETVDEP